MNVRNTPSGKVAVESLLIIGLLLGWFALQTWVLPSLGVPT